MKKEKEVYVKTFYCKDFFRQGDGDSIFDLFLLAEATRVSDHNNIEWLDLTLEDISGTIKARVWDEDLKSRCVGCVGKLVLVKGSISRKSGTPDLTVTNVVLLRGDTTLTDEKGNLYSSSDLVRCIDPLIAMRYKEKIGGVIKALKNERLRELVMRILNENMLDRMERLQVHIKGHHSYRGGLLAHTMEVAQGVYYYMTNTMEMRRMPYDRNLAVAGALLHDLPETMFMEETGYVCRKRKQAELYGSNYALHVMLDKNRQGMDDKTYGLLLHIIESSHNHVKPCCMEAEIVRMVNQMSIFAEKYENAFRRHAILYGAEPESMYSEELGRELVKVGRRKDEEGNRND